MSDNKKVLVIDDDSDFSYVLGLMLKSLGYTYDLATSREIALDKLKSNDYLCVFLDIMLRDQDGLELSREIKNNSNAVKIVILSAMSETIKGEIVKKSAADVFLAKPVKREQLSKILSMW